MSMPLRVGRPDTKRGQLEAIGSAETTASRGTGRGGQGGPGQALTTGSENWPADASTARHVINALQCRMLPRPTRENRRYRA